MTIQYINTGTAPNQGNGDTLRTAFNKINNNFAELADAGFATDVVGSVISDPTLQRGIAVTYNENTQKASFLVNIADQSTLGAVKIGSGISVNAEGLISAFDGNYDNLANIPQELSITSDPTFNNLLLTQSLNINDVSFFDSTSLRSNVANLILANNAADDLSADGAGLVVNGPSPAASILYRSSDDSWVINKRVNALSVYVNNNRAVTANELGNIRFGDNTISSAGDDEDILLNPNGIGLVRLISSSLQFDNGNNQPIDQHLVYSAPNSGKVGLGLAESNNSLRIVGDGVNPGVVADFGTYANGTGTWTSNFVVNSDSSISVPNALVINGSTLTIVDGELELNGIPITSGGTLGPNALISGTSTLKLSSNGMLVLDQQGAYNDQEIFGTLFRIDTDQPNYTQMTLQNINTGSTATSDIMFIRNDGSVEEGTGILDIGINSADYNDPELYGVHTPGSAYMFTNDADLIIGTQNPGKRLVFHAGGSTLLDSAGYLDDYAWRFNRNVQVTFNAAGPLNFLVRNTQNNSAAQAVYQAMNDFGDYLKMGINSSNAGSQYGAIGPREAFVHIEQSTSTLHIGGAGNLVFWSEETTGGYENGTTATLVMSRLDRSSTFGGHLLPAEDLAYDLGSSSTQWRSLYVGTSTIYLGGTALGIEGNGLTINGNLVRPFPVVSVPLSSKGAEGDIYGTMAFDQDYIYYCSAAYTDGQDDIWKRVQWSGETW